MLLTCCVGRADQVVRWKWWNYDKRRCVPAQWVIQPIVGGSLVVVHPNFELNWFWHRPSHSGGDISSELYGYWLWDENFKFCLFFTHFSRFSPFSGYIWWNNTLSSLENFSLNSILFFLVLMSHPDNGGFLKIAQKRDSISKKTSFCIMVINTDHQESWFLSVGHPLCALR